MTLQEAIDHLAPFFDLDLDTNDQGTLTDQKYATMLWYAARRLYQDVDFYQHTVTFDPVAGDKEFALQFDTIGGTNQIGNPLFKVTEARVNDSPIQIVSWSRFDSYVAKGWRTATNGKPVYCAVTPNLTLVFNRPFDLTTISEGGMGLSGNGCPNHFDASLVSAEWDCHPLLQWAVIRGAVPTSTDAYLDGAGAATRLALIEQNAEADRKRFDDIQAEHAQGFDDMPTTYGEIAFG